MRKVRMRSILGVAFAAVLTTQVSLAADNVSMQRTHRDWWPDKLDLSPLRQPQSNLQSHGTKLQLR